MFILPLMAILLGIEFYLVFERTTNTYEKGLTEGYSMLVVTKKPMELSTFKALNTHVSSSEKIERESIVSEVAKGINKSTSEAILEALPYFYNVGLDAYLHSSGLEEIKKDVNLILAIYKILDPLKKLEKKLEDSALLAGSEAYLPSIAIYNSIKAEALRKRHVPQKVSA